MTGSTLSGSLEQRRARRVGLVALCVTEVVSWGVLYYAFPVALSAITAATGWSAGGASAAFSAGLVVSAVAGIGAGRVLDARGPRLVMTLGSLLAVPALLLIALAPTLVWFTAGWVLAGFAMAATFYPPAFAALTRWYGEQRMKALTALTLVAGSSSTIFAPLTAWLLQHFSWRGTYLVLGLVLAAVTIPLHAFALPPTGHRHNRRPSRRQGRLPLRRPGAGGHRRPRSARWCAHARSCCCARPSPSWRSASTSPASA